MDLPLQLTTPAADLDAWAGVVMDCLRRNKMPALKFGKSGVPRLTRVWVSLDGASVEWSSQWKHSSEARCPFSSITEIDLDQSSPNFSRANRSISARLLSRAPSRDPDNRRRSISFFWAGRTQSLDLVFKRDQPLVLRCLKFTAARRGLDTAFVDFDNVAAAVANALKRSAEMRRAVHAMEPVQAAFIRSLFLEADVDGNGYVDAEEAMAISVRLKLGRPASYVGECVTLLADPDAGGVDLEHFEALMMKLGGDHDTLALWAALCTESLRTLAEATGVATAARNRPLLKSLVTGRRNVSMFGMFRGSSRATISSTLDTSKDLLEPTDQLHKFLKGDAKSSVGGFYDRKVCGKTFFVCSLFFRVNFLLSTVLSRSEVESY